MHDRLTSDLNVVLLIGVLAMLGYFAGVARGRPLTRAEVNVIIISCAMLCLTLGMVLSRDFHASDIIHGTFLGAAFVLLLIGAGRLVTSSSLIARAVRRRNPR